MSSGLHSLCFNSLLNVYISIASIYVVVVVVVVDRFNSKNLTAISNLS